MNQIIKILILIFLSINIINTFAANTTIVNNGFNIDKPQFSFTGTISSISDGDTLWAYTGSNKNNTFKIRLLGFDTPESYIWGIKDYKFYGCGVSAKMFAENNLQIGKKYGFYEDNLAKKIDKYGRKLRFLKLSTGGLTSTGTYGYSILREGLANFYKYENQSFSGVYKQIDNENKLLGKGMYNAFCKAQDKYIKINKKRKGGEINKIIDKVIKGKNNFVYQLQNVNFDNLKTLTNSVIFLEKDDVNLTPDEISQLKTNGNILIGYVSIGEAETWRNYWNNEWVDKNGNITDKAPSWLGEKNPNWNSYRVKFWEKGWENLVFSRIDKLKKAGYDGILLDVVNVYSYWQNDAPDDDKVADADDRMVSFIGKIRKHLGNYLAIIPNGGLSLVNKNGYLNLINGQLTEDLFSLNNKERSEEDKNWQLQYLDKVYEAGKQVFDIDYISKFKNNLVCKFYNFIKQKGFLSADYNLGLDSFNKIKCNSNINNILYGKGLWVWKTSFNIRLNGKLSWKYFYDNENQQNILVNFVKQNNIKKIYFYIGSLQGGWDKYFSKHILYNEKGLSILLKKLNILGVKVYALYYINDNPNNLDNYKKVIDIIQSVSEYNNRYKDAQFVGLQLDQEISKLNLQDKFINMLKIIEKASNKYGLINQVAIRPLWTRQDYKGKNFSKAIFENIDEGVIMAYSNDLNIIENIVNNSLFGNLDIGINFNKKTIENESFYNKIKENGLYWFENNIEKKIKDKYSLNTLFKGISIHDYVSYFYLQNGIEPINYKDKITPIISIGKYQKMLNSGLNVTWAVFNNTKNYLKQEDINNFKEIGFSTVRIRVSDDYKKLNFKSLKDYILYIKKLVDMTEKAGLIPVLSFDLKKLSLDPSENNVDYEVEIRRNFISYFKGKYANLSFDLGIEPGKELNKKYKYLLEFYVKIIKTIRKIDPNRILMIIGPSRGNPEYMYKLEQNSDLVNILKTDKHLIIQFHFLAGGPYKEGKHSNWTTGTDNEKNNLEKRLKIAIKFGKKYNLPLWFGAWMPGNYNHTYDNGLNNDYSIKEQIKFSSFFTSLLKKYNISFAINADSQFYNYKKHQWNNRINVVKAIIHTWNFKKISNENKSIFNNNHLNESNNYGNFINIPICKDNQLVCKKSGNKYIYFRKPGNICGGAKLGMVCIIGYKKKIELLAEIHKNIIIHKYGKYNLIEIKSSKYNYIFNRIGNILLKLNILDNYKNILIDRLNEIHILFNLYNNKFLSLVDKKDIKVILKEKISNFIITYRNALKFRFKNYNN